MQLFAFGRDESSDWAIVAFDIANPESPRETNRKKFLRPIGWMDSRKGIRDSIAVSYLKFTLQQLATRQTYSLSVMDVS